MLNPLKLGRQGILAASSGHCFQIKFLRHAQLTCYICIAFTFQGNHSIVNSPDEYTVSMQTPRGVKEFQFDSIFMPDSTQDQVFEDTNVSC